MADTVTPPSATDAPPPDPQPTMTPHVDTPSPPEDAPLGEGGKRALDAERKARRELEARIKELEPLAKAAREREEAEKSETTKLNEALTSERDARTKAEVTLLRYEIAAAKGVPVELVKFLTGSSKEEIEQSVTELLDAVGNNKPAMPGRPTERMVNGRPSTSSLDKDDPVTLIRKGRGEIP